MGTNAQGHLVDRTVRVTDGYRKIGGNWLIVLGKAYSIHTEFVQHLIGSGHCIGLADGRFLCFS
jgi:hypothetical protein